jgi:4-hydroxybenzoate polyprenyltransferase
MGWLGGLQRVGRQINYYRRLVALEHTVFALPFALSALVLACPVGQWPSGATVGWVVLGMLGGRTYAMGLNRLADATIDAKNPRTAQREIPAGLVSRAEAVALTLAALALLVLAAWQLPPLCLQLLPLAVAVLTLYSYTKRFTSLCHWVLGVALGGSAVAGWVAQTGCLEPPALWLGLAVCCWVSGFDVIYACQDVAFDRAEGLFSVPARLGVATALRLSQLSHALCVLCLGVLCYGFAVPALGPGVGGGYWVVVAAMAALLAYEHTLVRADDLSRVNQAFFVVNGYASVGFFVAMVALHALAAA